MMKKQTIENTSSSPSHASKPVIFFNFPEICNTSSFLFLWLYNKLKNKMFLMKQQSCNIGLRPLCLDLSLSLKLAPNLLHHFPKSCKMFSTWNAFIFCCNSNMWSKQQSSHFELIPGNHVLYVSYNHFHMPQLYNTKLLNHIPKTAWYFSSNSNIWELSYWYVPNTWCIYLVIVSQNQGNDLNLKSHPLSCAATEAKFAISLSQNFPIISFLPNSLLNSQVHNTTISVVISYASIMV